MIIPKSELHAVLRQLNPWWQRPRTQELPTWRRTAFSELMRWLLDPPAHRAVLVSGARQVGKTTLLLQAVEELLARCTPPEQIIYVTFDHPLMKLIGLKGVLDLWQEIKTPHDQPEYLLLDEVQFTREWPTWLKHQIDFQKRRRIALTGSAVSFDSKASESGVGRWHTIKLPTLSFFEYLQIKRIDVPEIPPVASLSALFQWSQAERLRVSELARPLVPRFHDYLLRGGFPQTAMVENITTAQRLLREDIVDKVLKQDMTALFGVRRVLELERTFLYLCLHDGGILDLTQLCSSLELKKPTVNNFLALLEAAHLIYRLPPYGYGKEILRAKYKVYLADAAIPGSVLLKGKALFEDRVRLGAAVETAVFKHIFSNYYQVSIGFSYWRGKKGVEVDIVADVQGDLIPFEVKYGEGEVRLADLKGLRSLCECKRLSRAYVVTRDIGDFDVLPLPASESAGPKKEMTSVLKIPAPLACYWLSRLGQSDEFERVA